MDTDLTHTRIELKYVIPSSMVDEVLVRIPADVRQEYRVTTIYFDSPDRLLSQIALEEPYRCVKIRAREYLGGSSYVWFEVKSRSGAWTRKWRFRVEKSELDGLLAGGLDLDLDSLQAGPGAEEGEMDEARRTLEAVSRGRLVPLGAVYARRRTFELEESQIRFTLDEDIRYHAPPADLYGAHPTFLPEVLGAPLHREPKAVLELKHGGDVPLWCTRIIAELSVSSYSKFRTLLRFVESSGKVVGNVDRV